MARNGFPKSLRLLRQSEFERVFAARTSAADSLVIMYGTANDQRCARLGLVVSRRLGDAVVRNRWKRLLREAFRLSHPQLPALDIVCIAKSHQPPTLSGVLKTLPQLANRIETKLQRASERARDIDT
jgi:ribonuclease P protein component